jgi:hypothetical protein
VSRTIAWAIDPAGQLYLLKWHAEMYLTWDGSGAHFIQSRSTCHNSKGMDT